MPFSCVALWAFYVFGKNVNGIKKYFNPTVGGGGGAQSNGFGLVLLCNSGKTVLAKTFGFSFGV